MNYTDKLKESADKTGSIICMGLDPVPEYLPELSEKTGKRITVFFETLFNGMIKKNVIPGAFKPNLGFFSCLDRPRDNKFAGSTALAEILSMLEAMFPGIPVILDYKRGDIARSSANYAEEGFTVWGCDSVTVSPWMGGDSVEPFLEKASRHDGGVYLLNRTSNPGGKDFQDPELKNTGKPVYTLLSEYIVRWAQQYPGTGAVAGATSLQELEKIMKIFRGKEIPLLIPGVGTQGGNAGDIAKILKKTGYDARFARINVSSGITHPWIKEGTAVPSNWQEVCIQKLQFFNEEAGRKTENSTE